MHRLLVGTHGRFSEGESVVYKAGDLIPDLSEEEARSLGDRIELASGAMDWSGILADSAWKDAVELVGGLDGVGDLSDLRRAEERGKNRQSVIRAVEERLEELEGEG